MSATQLDTAIRELEQAARALRAGGLDADRAAELVDRCAEIAAQIGRELDQAGRDAERGGSDSGQERLL
jgi:hypothetical protein